MSSAKYLPLLARSLDRAAAGGHARVPPIRLSRSAAARAIIPAAVLLARDPPLLPSTTIQSFESGAVMLGESGEVLQCSQLAT